MNISCHLHSSVLFCLFSVAAGLCWGAGAHFKKQKDVEELSAWGMHGKFLIILSNHHTSQCGL